MKTIENRNYVKPMRNAKMHLIKLVFLLLGRLFGMEGGGGGELLNFLCSQSILDKFLLCSQHVLVAPHFVQSDNFSKFRYKQKPFNY
jgi:hypothetical protein